MGYDRRFKRFREFVEAVVNSRPMGAAVHPSGYTRCTDCGGTGKVSGRFCDACHGSGQESTLDEDGAGGGGAVGGAPANSAGAGNIAGLGVPAGSKFGEPGGRNPLGGYTSGKKKKHYKESKQEPIIETTDEDIEKAAAAVHNRWVQNQKKTGETEHKSPDGTEDYMVPYHKLSDTSKEMDRDAARATLDALGLDEWDQIPKPIEGGGMQPESFDGPLRYVKASTGWIIMQGYDNIFRGFQYQRNPFNTRPMDAKVYKTRAEAESDLDKLREWIGWPEDVFNKTVKIWDASHLTGFRMTEAAKVQPYSKHAKLSNMGEPPKRTDLKVGSTCEITGAFDEAGMRVKITAITPSGYYTVKDKKGNSLGNFHGSNLKKLNEERETFAGAPVFEVDTDKWMKSRFGKNRYHRYSKYVGEDDKGEEIRQHGRTKRKEDIILKDQATGAMTWFLRRKKTGQ